MATGVRQGGRRRRRWRPAGHRLDLRVDRLELAALQRAGPPFFDPPWRPTIVGMVIDDNVDWDEVGELLTESYRMLAPKRLVDALDRQDD